MNKIKIVKFSLAVLLSFGISNISLATPILITSGPSTNTDVGLIDNFIAEAEKVGNPTEEETWVNSILSSMLITVTYTIKTEDVLYYTTNATNVFAFDATPASDYFLIKNATRMALFENLSEINWGVFDTGDLTPAMHLPDTSEYKISHVTRFNDDGGGGLQVPEPGMMGLLGMGLLGMGLSRIRRRRKAS